MGCCNYLFILSLDARPPKASEGKYPLEVTADPSRVTNARPNQAGPLAACRAALGHESEPA